MSAKWCIEVGGCGGGCGECGECGGGCGGCGRCGGGYEMMYLGRWLQAGWCQL